MKVLRRLLFVRKGYRDEDYPSAVAIADKCRELGAEYLRGKRACADSQGWVMTVEGTVRRW